MKPAKLVIWASATIALAGCRAEMEQEIAPVSIEGDRVTSILNSGVTAELGEDETAVKFLFDPLYEDHYGSFEIPEKELIASIISGSPPYDKVDAVFVSHAHGDHFSASQLAQLLAAQENVTLVAPTQAIDQLLATPEWQPSFEERLVAINIENGEAAQSFEIAGATIEAIRSPHTGWPDRHADVHNLSFRVSAPNGARVMHFGDADPSEQHFEPHTEFLASARTGLAIVPYWHLGADDPAKLIDQTFNAEDAVGMHVPVDQPEWLADSGWNYFNGLEQQVVVPETD